MIVNLPPNRALEYILGEDEHIECSNATIICDSEGKLRGWIDNTKPYPVIFADDMEIELN